MPRLPIPERTSPLEEVSRGGYAIDYPSFELTSPRVKYGGITPKQVQQMGQGLQNIVEGWQEYEETSEKARAAQLAQETDSVTQFGLDQIQNADNPQEAAQRYQEAMDNVETLNKEALQDKGVAEYYFPQTNNKIKDFKRKAEAQSKQKYENFISDSFKSSEIDNINKNPSWDNLLKAQSKIQQSVKTVTGKSVDKDEYSNQLYQSKIAEVSDAFVDANINDLGYKKLGDFKKTLEGMDASKFGWTEAQKKQQLNNIQKKKEKMKEIETDEFIEQSEELGFYNSNHEKDLLEKGYELGALTAGNTENYKNNLLTEEERLDAKNGNGEITLSGTGVRIRKKNNVPLNVKFENLSTVDQSKLSEDYNKQYTKLGQILNQAGSNNITRTKALQQITSLKLGREDTLNAMKSLDVLKSTSPDELPELSRILIDAVGAENAPSFGSTETGWFASSEEGSYSAQEVAKTRAKMIGALYNDQYQNAPIDEKEKLLKTTMEKANPSSKQGINMKYGSILLSNTSLSNLKRQADKALNETQTSEESEKEKGSWIDTSKRVMRHIL